MLLLTYLERIDYHVCILMIYDNNRLLCLIDLTNDKQMLMKNMFEDFVDLMLHIFKGILLNF